MAGVIQQSIYDALSATFDPSYLVVTNESHQHNVPPGSESHFKVVVVSDSFVDQRLIQRHQRVNRALATQLNGQIHALSITFSCSRPLGFNSSCTSLKIILNSS